MSRLDCRPEELLKVVSIFGNTGEGKSHTLNHTFFQGREVFQTSPTQESCTVGVWAAMDPIHRVVVIDTEGLLGAGEEERGEMTGILLKVSCYDIFIHAIDTIADLIKELLSYQIKITVGAVTSQEASTNTSSLLATQDPIRASAPGCSSKS